MDEKELELLLTLLPTGHFNNTDELRSLIESEGLGAIYAADTARENSVLKEQFGSEAGLVGAFPSLAPFSPVKKKDTETPLAPSASALDGNQTSVVSPQLSVEEQFGLGSSDPSDTYEDLVLQDMGVQPKKQKFQGLTYQLKDGNVSLRSANRPNLRDARVSSDLNIPNEMLINRMQQQGFLTTAKLLEPYRDQLPDEVSDVMRGMATYEVPTHDALQTITDVIAKDAQLSAEIFGVQVNPMQGGSYQPGLQTFTMASEEDMTEERKRVIAPILERNLYDAMAGDIVGSLPPEHQDNPESLHTIEDNIFQKTGMLMDLTGDGRIQTQPLLKFEGFEFAQGTGSSQGGYGAFGFPMPKFSGYLVDLAGAASVDLYNAIAQFYDGDKHVIERRQYAEKLRTDAMQFTRDFSDDSFGNMLDRTFGTMAEGAPFFAATFPLQIYTMGQLSAANASVSAIIAMTAAESTGLLYMQELARLKGDPEFNIYKKDGVEYTYEEMLMATGGDPEKALQYTAEVDIAAKYGYLGSIAATNFAIDGVSSAFFMRALRGMNTHTLAGPQMTRWWQNYAANLGYAVPVGAATSSIGAMQMYVARAEATGREISWSEVQNHGLQALTTGAGMGFTMTTMGTVSNRLQSIALAKDRFGRKMQNMNYLRQQEQILKRMQEATDPEQVAEYGKQYLELTNRNLARQLTDIEFYRRMSVEDRNELLALQDGMNEARRRMLMFSDEEDPLHIQAKKDLEQLTKQRDNLESLYEAMDQPVRYDDDGNLVERDPFAEGPDIPDQMRIFANAEAQGGMSTKPGYGPNTPRMMPIKPIRINGLMWNREGKASRVGYRKQNQSDEPLYESLIDRYEGIVNLQRSIQEREGLGLRVRLDQDVDAFLQRLESIQQAAVEGSQPIISGKGGVVDIIRGGRGTAIGKTVDKLTGQRTTAKILQENIEGIAPLMPKDKDGNTIPINPLSVFEQYRYAVHAPERNQHIYNKNQAEYKKLNGKDVLTAAEASRIRELERYMDSKRGSGMSDEQAQKFIESLPDELLTRFDEANTKLNEMILDTQNALLKYGMIDQDTYNGLKSNFKNYTPLYGRAILDNIIKPDGTIVVADNAYSKVPGSTYLDNKFLRQAQGRSEQTGDVVSKILMQNVEAHVLGNRNVAMTRLHNLMLDNPDPRYRIMDTGLEDAPNTQVVYINGQKKYLEFFNADGTPNLTVLRGLKAQPTKLGTIGDIFMYSLNATSQLRKIHVNYNPFFGPYAFFRDKQSAISNALFESQAKYGFALRDQDGMPVSSSEFMAMVNNPMRDFKAIALVAASESGLYKRFTGKEIERVQLFVEHGGPTGMTQMQSLRALARQLNEATDDKARLTFTNNWIKKYGFDFVMGFNTVLENAVRFNAFDAAMDLGIHPERAANIAKNISVNFNRKGTDTQVAQAAKYFFNPAIQGTDQVIGRYFGERGKAANVDEYGNPRSWFSEQGPRFKSMGAFAALGSLITMYNLAVSGEDPTGVDAYDLIKDWELYSRITVLDPDDPKGKRYNISLGYGHGMPYAWGVLGTEMAMGRRGVGSGTTFMMETMKHHLAPVYLSGPAEDKAEEGKGLADPVALMMDLGTFSQFKPVVAVYANRDPLTGREVYRDTPGIPDSEQSFRAPWIVGEWAKGINEWAGGSEHLSGDKLGMDMDWNPDPTWYMLESYLGGNLRFIEQTAEYKSKLELENFDPTSIDGFITVRDLPFINRFVTETPRTEIISRFYDYQDRMGQFENEFRDKLDVGKHIGKNQVYRERKMKEEEEGSEEFRYLAYLSTRSYAQAVRKANGSEGLGIVTDLMERRKDLIRREGLTEENMEEYYDLNLRIKKIQDTRIGLMAMFLKYAYIVSPPRVKE
jgi:hypothetical protein